MGYIVSRDSLKLGYRQSRKQQKLTVKREEKNTAYRFRTLFKDFTKQKCFTIH
jgi:hypothetical protein